MYFCLGYLTTRLVMRTVCKTSTTFYLKRSRHHSGKIAFFVSDLRFDFAGKLRANSAVLKRSSLRGIFAGERHAKIDNIYRVPTRTGKPGKMGKHFPVREKSGNFEQTGKVREKSGKIIQNTGKLGQFEININ